MCILFAIFYWIHTPFLKKILEKFFAEKKENTLLFISIAYHRRRKQKLFEAFIIV